MGARIGLVGCGRWGRNILRDLLRLDCQVYVCDPDAAARDFARNNAAAGSVKSHRDLPPDCDGYVVASPTVSHFEAVSALLPRRKPIFCEKPLTPDLASAESLAGRDEGFIYVMDKWRYHPGIEALAKLARDDELGEIQQIRTCRTQWGQPHKDVDGVWILAPHDVSIVQHILGYLPKPMAAYADFSGQRMDGLVAILGHQPAAIIEVSSRQPDSRRLVSVSFTQGVAWLSDPLDDHINIYPQDPGKAINPGGQQRRPIDSEWPLFLELRRFVRHLEGGPPPYTDAAGAVRQVAVIEQLRNMAGENTADG